MSLVEGRFEKLCHLSRFKPTSSFPPKKRNQQIMVVNLTGFFAFCFPRVKLDNNLTFQNVNNFLLFQRKEKTRCHLRVMKRTRQRQVTVNESLIYGLNIFYFESFRLKIYYHCSIDRYCYVIKAAI